MLFCIKFTKYVYVMMIVTVFILISKLKTITGCGVGITPPMLRPPLSHTDWKHWELPPYNRDWEGFVNLLGTREIKVKTTTQLSLLSDEEDIESQPGFPKDWDGIGIPYTGMNPPKSAKMEGNLGQPFLCLDRPEAGYGGGWYVRWYFDPHVGFCKRFVYQGRGGNTNRFVAEYNCNVTCVWGATLPCLPENLFDYHMYIGFRRLFFVRLH